MSMVLPDFLKWIRATIRWYFLVFFLIYQCLNLFRVLIVQRRIIELQSHLLIVFGEKLESSSLTFVEKLCASVFPIVAIIDALIFAISSCFDFKCTKLSKRKKLNYDYEDIVRLSQGSHCKSNFDLLNCPFHEAFSVCV